MALSFTDVSRNFPFRLMREHFLSGALCRKSVFPVISRATAQAAVERAKCMLPSLYLEENLILRHDDKFPGLFTPVVYGPIGTAQRLTADLTCDLFNVCRLLICDCSVKLEFTYK